MVCLSVTACPIEVRCSGRSPTVRSALICLMLGLGVTFQQLLGQNLNADSELRLGVAAYDKAEYKDAIDHLERVVTLSPKSVTGHFYLAKSYDSAYRKNAIGTATETSSDGSGPSKNITRYWNWNPKY